MRIRQVLEGYRLRSGCNKLCYADTICHLQLGLARLAMNTAGACVDIAGQVSCGLIGTCLYQYTLLHCC